MPGEGLAVLVEADTRGQCHIGECSVVIVAIQEALHGIVGDVDVRPPVAIEIGERHAERLALGVGDPGFPGHVGERAVAVVVIQQVSDAREIVGMAVGAAAGLVLAAEAVLVEAPLQITRHEQVEPAVIVEVEEPGAGAPSAGRDAGPRGDVAKTCRRRCCGTACCRRSR